MVETYPHLRESVLERLNQSVSSIKSTRVHRVALWIFAEYSSTKDEVPPAPTTAHHQPPTPYEQLYGSCAGERCSDRGLC